MRACNFNMEIEDSQLTLKRVTLSNINTIDYWSYYMLDELQNFATYCKLLLFGICRADKNSAQILANLE
jgi:hypothetical protein